MEFVSAFDNNNNNSNNTSNTEQFPFLNNRKNILGKEKDEVVLQHGRRYSYPNNIFLTRWKMKSSTDDDDDVTTAIGSSTSSKPNNNNLLTHTLNALKTHGISILKKNPTNAAPNNNSTTTNSIRTNTSQEDEFVSSLNFVTETAPLTYSSDDEGCTEAAAPPTSSSSFRHHRRRTTTTTTIFYPWKSNNTTNITNNNRRRTQSSSPLLQFHPHNCEVEILDEEEEEEEEVVTSTRRTQQRISSGKNCGKVTVLQSDSTLLPKYSSLLDQFSEDDSSIHISNNNTQVVHDSYDENDDHRYVQLKKFYQEEIRKLKDRIALLESELNVRKNLEEVFVVESSSSSSCSNSSSSNSSQNTNQDELSVSTPHDDSSLQSQATLHSLTEETVPTSTTLTVNGNTPSINLIDIEQFCNSDATLLHKGEEGEVVTTRNGSATDVLVDIPISMEKEHGYTTTECSSLHCSNNNIAISSSQQEQQNMASQLKQSSLTKEQVERYSRHLLLSNGFGVSGQLQLLQSSVLVIGAGGIGSTVLLYLAAAGVGTIGVVDFDSVELSNLHRQVIHCSTKLGMNKATSAVGRMQELNPTVNFVAIQEAFTHQNAMRLVSSYDCIVDASDNPFTRYLVNDACVLSNKPLVSGSSMGVEGQLTVHNYLGGPCYRCLYPKASPSEACKSCSDNGVLGPVPGMIGVLQAIEVIKILTRTGTTMHDKMLMYDALQCCFLRVKKSGKRKTCAVCGPDAWIKCMEDSLRASLMDNIDAPTAVVKQAGFPLNKEGNSAKSTSRTLPAISCFDYFKLIVTAAVHHVLLDVRVAQQYAIVSIKDSVNIPLENLHIMLAEVERLSEGKKAVYCICRRGIASSEATRIIMDAIASGKYPYIHSVINITGGLIAWANEVDKDFPLY